MKTFLGIFSLDEVRIKLFNQYQKGSSQSFNLSAPFQNPSSDMLLNVQDALTVLRQNSKAIATCVRQMETLERELLMCTPEERNTEIHYNVGGCEELPS